MQNKKKKPSKDKLTPGEHAVTLWGVFNFKDRIIADKESYIKLFGALINLPSSSRKPTTPLLSPLPTKPQLTPILDSSPEGIRNGVLCSYLSIIKNFGRNTDLELIKRCDLLIGEAELNVKLIEKVQSLHLSLTTEFILLLAGILRIILQSKHIGILDSKYLLKELPILYSLSQNKLDDTVRILKDFQGFFSTKNETNQKNLFESSRSTVKTTLVTLDIHLQNLPPVSSKHSLWYQNALLDKHEKDSKFFFFENLSEPFLLFEEIEAGILVCSAVEHKGALREAICKSELSADQKKKALKSLDESKEYIRANSLIFTQLFGEKISVTTEKAHMLLNLESLIKKSQTSTTGAPIDDDFPLMGSTEKELEIFYSESDLDAPTLTFYYFDSLTFLGQPLLFMESNNELLFTDLTLNFEKNTKTCLDSSLSDECKHNVRNLICKIGISSTRDLALAEWSKLKVHKPVFHELFGSIQIWVDPVENTLKHLKILLLQLYLEIIGTYEPELTNLSQEMLKYSNHHFEFAMNNLHSLTKLLSSDKKGTIKDFFQKLLMAEKDYDTEHNITQLMESCFGKDFLKSKQLPQYISDILLLRCFVVKKKIKAAEDKIDIFTTYCKINNEAFLEILNTSQAYVQTLFQQIHKTAASDRNTVSANNNNSAMTPKKSVRDGDNYPNLQFSNNTTHEKLQTIEEEEIALAKKLSLETYKKENITTKDPEITEVTFKI